MATKRPSYLKRLKEQKRNERALEKRNAREGRRRLKPFPMGGEEPSVEAIESTENQYD